MQTGKCVDKKPSNTLCWSCRRALLTKNGCIWAWDHMPVPGWKAEEKLLFNGNGRYRVPVISYVVKKCPLYEEDER